MPPRPQLSLCVPPPYDKNSFSDFVENVTTFFQKFPIQYEVLICTPPDPNQSLPAAFKVVHGAHVSSRAQTLKNLFQGASGDHLMAANLDLSIPLSEYFKILEAFYSDRSLDAVFGDRTKKKKQLENTPSQQKLIGLEGLFNGIIQEKKKWAFADPFCPVFALKKSSFDKIVPSLQAHGWHWTPEVQNAAQSFDLKTQEIPLYAGSRALKSSQKVSEFLGLLHFVLFRI